MAERSFDSAELFRAVSVRFNESWKCCTIYVHVQYYSCHKNINLQYWPLRIKNLGKIQHDKFGYFAPRINFLFYSRWPFTLLDDCSYIHYLSGHEEYELGYNVWKNLGMTI